MIVAPILTGGWFLALISMAVFAFYPLQSMDENELHV